MDGGMEIGRNKWREGEKERERENERERERDGWRCVEK